MYKFDPVKINMVYFVRDISTSESLKNYLC